MIFFKRVLIGFVVLFTTLLMVHYAFKQLTTITNTQVVAKKSGLTEREVTSLIDAAFEASGSTPPTKGEDARRESPTEQETILRTIKQTDVEIYVLQKTETIVWRIYNNRGLQYILTFPKNQEPKSSDPIEMVSAHSKKPVVLILTGIKYKDVSLLMDLDIPLNLAVVPESPFALKNAVSAANNWHEVVLDIRNSSEFTIDSVPFVTGVLSATDIPLPFINVVQEQDSSTIEIGQSSLPDNNIWILNIADHSIQDVRDWLTALPKTLQFRRVSFADITLSSMNSPTP